MSLVFSPIAKGMVFRLHRGQASTKTVGETKRAQARRGSGQEDAAMAVNQVARVEADDNQQRDRIILEHLPLVKAIAVRVHENLRSMSTWTISSMPAYLGCLMPSPNTTPTRKSLSPVTQSIGSRVLSWTTSVSSTGPPGICGAATNRWRLLPGHWPRHCTVHRQSRKSPQNSVLKQSGGAR